MIALEKSGAFIRLDHVCFPQIVALVGSDPVNADEAGTGNQCWDGAWYIGQCASSPIMLVIGIGRE